MNAVLGGLLDQRRPLAGWHSIAAAARRIIDPALNAGTVEAKPIGDGLIATAALDDFGSCCHGKGL